jgi:hypothetical protein
MRAKPKATASSGPIDDCSWTIAKPSTTTPTRTSTSRQIRTSRTLERSWTSSGLVRTKSNVPWRMSPRSRSMFGWMNEPMSPPMIVCTPMTASSSGWDQPLRAGVWLKTRARTASPVPSAIPDWRSWSQKFARYWSSLRAPIRKKSQSSRKGRIA